MEAQKQKKVEIIKTVDNAMKVLDVLREQNDWMDANEIAKFCKLSPPITFRILNTLENSGWVFRLNDGRYIVEQTIDFVPEKSNFYLALREVASMVMKQYVEEYGVAMNLMVRDGDACIILEQARTNNIIDYVPPIQSKLPFYACAGGKILLSELPIHMVELIVGNTKIVPLTSHSIKTSEELWEELQKTAKRKYAFDHQESAEKGSCVAVPVRDNENTIIAALSFSGFIGINDTEQLLKYIPILVEASEKITQGLFCRKS